MIEHDWMHLIHDKGVLDSPNYLRERGKAVVTFWGFGFADSGHDPAVVRAITRFVRENTPGGAYIMAGTPAHWRTSVSDADPNPEFVNVWLEEFDAISPWTIGRYHNEESADWFHQDKIVGDVKLINERNQRWEQTRQGRKVDYIPVVFPGGSVRASSFLFKAFLLTSRAHDHRVITSLKGGGVGTTLLVMVVASCGGSFLMSVGMAFESSTELCGTSKSISCRS